MTVFAEHVCVPTCIHARRGVDKGSISPPAQPTKTVSPKYTPECWRAVGKALALAALDIVGGNPCSRLGAPSVGGFSRLRGTVAGWVKTQQKKESKRAAARAARAGSDDEEDDGDEEELDDEPEIRGEEEAGLSEEDEEELLPAHAARLEGNADDKAAGQALLHSGGSAGLDGEEDGMGERAEEEEAEDERLAEAADNEEGALVDSACSGAASVPVEVRDPHAHGSAAERGGGGLPGGGPPIRGRGIFDEATGRLVRHAGGHGLTDLLAPRLEPESSHEPLRIGMHPGMHAPLHLSRTRGVADAKMSLPLASAASLISSGTLVATAARAAARVQGNAHGMAAQGIGQGRVLGGQLRDRLLADEILVGVDALSLGRKDRLAARR